MKSTELSKRKCPACGHDIEASTHLVDEVSPEPGDVSVCLYCGEFYIFDDDMNFRDPTPEEYVRLEATPELDLVRRAAVLVHKRMR